MYKLIPNKFDCTMDHKVHWLVINCVGVSVDNKNLACYLLFFGYVVLFLYVHLCCNILY